MKKVYVFDTSVLLTNYNSLFEYRNNNIIIPLKVLEEIDKNKKRQDGAGLNARMTIRKLDELRSKGNLHKGVRLGKGLGILSIRGYDLFTLPDEFEPSEADNVIIATALTENAKDLKRKVIVVTRDINMRVKCDALGLPCEDYTPIAVEARERNELYTGFKSHLIDDQVIDRFYSDEEVYLEEDEVKVLPNQFIMLVSNINEKKTALARFIDYGFPLRKVRENKGKGIWGVRPRNKEQMFSLDLLMDRDVPIVSLIGQAGSGKTLLAIAAGLEQVLSDGRYKKLVVSRPVQPVGKDIGFLPGTVEEKMSPWLAPIKDNLEYLMAESVAKTGDMFKDLESYIYDGTIEVEALTYIRGRSISNAYIIIDEAQNLTFHELKTIITRVGEGTKIILTGDVEQIDNLYVDVTSNGLSYAVEKFKKYDLAGHITLLRGERSKVATLAAKIL